MLFSIKQLLKALIMPVPLLLILGGTGLVLLWRGRRPRLARALLTLALGLLFLLSFQPVSQLPGILLERHYPAYSGQPVEYVVVLGGGHTSDQDLPITAWPKTQSLSRVSEGVRIAQINPEARLIFSGFGGTDSISSAEANRRLAVALGVDSTRILTEPEPRDTRDEARAMASVLATRPFALVTSATHMPRAVKIFREEGLDPIPAPTGHLVRRKGGLHLIDLIPSSENLKVSRQLWYELLGTVWNSVRP